MCDTMCSLPIWSKERNTLFAKNSDRPPEEPQHVLWQPPVKYSHATHVKCTYIEIPQSSYTYGVMMYKPAWCWGCEMGVNDRGVAIGNEAVYTKETNRHTALIGMDFVRIALERAEKAENAIDIITQLLERYGQGGQCGEEVELFYDNSFLIVDPNKGFILETAGKKWAARPVDKYDAISNELSICTDHTMRGGVHTDINFASELTDPILSRAYGARQRRKAMLRSLISPPTTRSMMTILRSHNLNQGAEKKSRHSICMHPEVVGSNTAGSLVAVLRNDNYSTLWTTGSSLPCLSMFKPIFLGKSWATPLFSDSVQSNAYWIEREMINSGLAQNEEYLLQRDALEIEWLNIEAELISENANASVLADFSKATIQQEQELISRYIKK